MMQVRLIEKEDEAEWNAVLSGLPHAIAHTHAFATCMARSAGSNVFLFVAEHTHGRAACVMSERFFQGQPDIYTPYGFGGFVGIGDLSGLRDAWEEFATSRGYVASYLMQHPILMPAEVGVSWSENISSDRHLYVVDLLLSAEERFQLVSSRKRAELTKWLKRTEPETDQLVLKEAFVDLYPSFSKRRKMAKHYQFSGPLLSELASLPAMHLVGVRGRDGEVSCVILMGSHGPCGDYLFMASSIEGEREGTGVIWVGLEELAAQGVSMCNLGGGIREGDGVAEMKRRLGGVAQKIPVIQEVMDPDRYKTLCKTAGHLAEDAQFFPAYHMRADT